MILLYLVRVQCSTWYCTMWKITHFYYHTPWWWHCTDIVNWGIQIQGSHCCLFRFLQLLQHSMYIKINFAPGRFPSSKKFLFVALFCTNFMEGHKTQNTNWWSYSTS